MKWSNEDELLYSDPKSSYKIEFLNNNSGEVIRTEIVIVELFLDVLKTAHKYFNSIPRDGSLDSLMPSMRTNRCRISRQTKSGWNSIIETDLDTIEDRIQILTQEDDDYELGYNTSPIRVEKTFNNNGFGRGKKRR